MVVVQQGSRDAPAADAATDVVAGQAASAMGGGIASDVVVAGAKGGDMTEVVASKAAEEEGATTRGSGWIIVRDLREFRRLHGLVRQLDNTLPRDISDTAEAKRFWRRRRTS